MSRRTNNGRTEYNQININRSEWATSKASIIKMRARSRRRSRRNLLLVLLVVAVVVTFASFKAVSLHEKSSELAITERQLQAEINEAKELAEDLENREKYMQTKKYVEDEAKNKLGLVYPDEIVIRASEGK